MRMPEVSGIAASLDRPWQRALWYVKLNNSANSAANDFMTSLENLWGKLLKFRQMSQDLSVKKLILITYNLGPHSSQNIANFILPHKLTLMKLPSTCLAGYPLKGVLWAVFILLSVSLDAQRLYQISGVEVDRGGNALINAWTGGFNNPVISPIDLDQDGLMDLFIYDKAGFKAQAFINNGAVGSPSYRYAPEYDVTFPKGLTDWAVIRDYNKDGVPDIFALTGKRRCLSGQQDSRRWVDFHQDQGSA
jgi:hypothetical protein